MHACIHLWQRRRKWQAVGHPVTDRWEAIESAYHIARDLNGDARARFLDRRCGPDRDMRQQLEALLAEDLNATSFLNHAAVELRRDHSALLEPCHC